MIGPAQQAMELCTHTLTLTRSLAHKHPTHRYGDAIEYYESALQQHAELMGLTEGAGTDPPHPELILLEPQLLLNRALAHRYH